MSAIAKHLDHSRAFELAAASLRTLRAFGRGSLSKPHHVRAAKSARTKLQSLVASGAVESGAIAAILAGSDKNGSIVRRSNQ
jgi:hypothetical protein